MSMINAIFARVMTNTKDVNGVVKIRKDLSLITTELLQKQKEKNISVADVIALINM